MIYKYSLLIGTFYSLTYIMHLTHIVMLGYIHIIKSKYDIASLGRHFDIIFLCKKVSYLLRHSYYFVQYDTILYCTVRQNTIQCYSVIEWNKIFWKLHNTDTLVSWLFFIVWIFFSSIFSSINLLYIAK